jgi:hypothetical protein
MLPMSTAPVWEPGRNDVHKLIQLCDVLAIALNRFYQLSFRLPEETDPSYMAERQRLRNDFYAVRGAIFPNADIAPQHTAFRLATAAVAELAREGSNDETPIGDAQQWLTHAGWVSLTPYPKAILSPLHKTFDEERRVEGQYADIRNRLFAALARTGQTIPDHIHQRRTVMVNPWSEGRDDPISQDDLLAMVRATKTDTEPATPAQVPGATSGAPIPPSNPPGADLAQLRLKCYPPVPLAELHPRRPEPHDLEVTAAMRAVPVALSGSRFGAPGAHMGLTECEHWLEYPAWLACAQEWGHGRPAAEWAVYRLVEMGFLCVVWPEVDRLVPITGERAKDRAEQYRGRVATVTDWDLFERGRIWQIRSTPALWEWVKSRYSTNAPTETTPVGGGKPTRVDNSQPSPKPTVAQTGEGETPQPNDTKTPRDPRQPSRDRQDDILAAIASAETPLTRPELVEAMKLKTEGKLGAHLAWMVENNVLVNFPQRGYWPADRSPPE